MLHREIRRATLTLTATANTKTYDSTTTAGAMPTVTGLSGTDTVAELTGNLHKLQRGRRATSHHTIVNDGNSGNNYSITLVDINGLINQQC